MPLLHHWSHVPSHECNRPGVVPGLDQPKHDLTSRQQSLDDNDDVAKLPVLQLGRGFLDAVDAAATRTMLELLRARKTDIPQGLVGVCSQVMFPHSCEPTLHLCAASQRLIMVRLSESV